MRMLTVITLVVAGCATPQQMSWFKDGSTRQTFDMDTGACRAQSYSVPNAMQNLVQTAVVFDSCMQGKGWQLRPH